MVIKRDAPNEEVRLYLDESGDESPDTPFAVIGGVLTNDSGFSLFEEEWDAMLSKHSLSPPIHMRDFGRPHGRFAFLDDCCREELFRHAAEIVRQYRLCTLGITLSNEEYRKHIPLEVREVYSVYAMCFIGAVVINHKLAEKAAYKKKVAFILDEGNSHKGHVLAGHAAALAMQNSGIYFNAGSLTFADDADFGILQAADMISWGMRRRISGQPFNNGTRPILELLEEERDHFEQQLKPEWLEEIGKQLKLRIEEENAKEQ